MIPRLIIPTRGCGAICHSIAKCWCYGQEHALRDNFLFGMVHKFGFDCCERFELVVLGVLGDELALHGLLLVVEVVKFSLLCKAGGTEVANRVNVMAVGDVSWIFDE